MQCVFHWHLNWKAAILSRFTPAQYDALLPLLQAIKAQYPINSIAGHEHIAPQRKTDPGHFFDWQWLQDIVD